MTPGRVRLGVSNGMGGSLQHVGTLFVVLVTLVVVVMTLAPRVHLPAMVGLVLVRLALSVSGVIGSLALSPHSCAPGEVARRA
jgi:uncharacterized membrane protein